MKANIKAGNVIVTTNQARGKRRGLKKEGGVSRPKFLDCVMTPAIISRIRERQEEYDKDPEGYERREKQKEEDRQREEQACSEGGIR